MGDQLGDILAEAKDINGVKLITKQFDDLTINDLRTLSDDIKASNKSVIMVFAAVNGGKVTFMVSITDDLLDRYHAGNMIKKIAAAYRQATAAKLTVVTKNASDCGETVAWQGEKVVYESDNLVAAGKGAVKESGYTSAQMNTKQVFSDGTVGNGEMQLRGVEVDGFADVEHIPYDIRKGKIKATDLKYSKVYSTIKSLGDESYARYNQYLTSVYKALRLRELGFTNVELPKIGTGYFTKDGIAVDVSKIDFDGLLKYAHK